MGQPEQVAPQKPNCVRTALQTQIDILKEKGKDGTDCQGFNNSGTVYLDDAIQALEDLEVALTDCYKSQ